MTTRAVSASSAVPVTRASTGSADGLPASTQPISTSAATAALSAASAGRDVRRGPAELPGIPGPARHESAQPGGAAQHAEPGDQQQLGGRAGVPVGDLRPDREHVADGHREQGDDRCGAAASRRHREREHAAEHEQVGERVDELGGERARVITRVRVAGAEHRDPADDEQGGRHHVPVRAAGHRGADPGPVPLGQRMTRRLAP